MSHLLCQGRVEAEGKCRSAIAIVVGSQQPTRICHYIHDWAGRASSQSPPKAPLRSHGSPSQKRATKLRHKLLPTSALQRPAKGVLHGRKQLGNLGDIPLDIALFLQILQFLVSLASNQRPTRGEDAALRNRWCGTCGTCGTAAPTTVASKLALVIT